MLGINMLKPLLKQMNLDPMKNDLAKGIDLIGKKYIDSILSENELNENEVSAGLFGFVENETAYIMQVTLDADFNIVRKLGVFELKKEIEKLNINELVEMI